MTEEVQNTEVQEKPIVLNIQLNIAQINAVVDALGKLPTETGVFPLRQQIITQAEQQLATMQPADDSNE